MEIFSSYNLIIIVSIIIIISFLFDKIAKRTNIPSVLMLIALGVGLQYGLRVLDIRDIDFFPLLNLLGIVGLIMIVLEAALELELRRDKLWLILKAFAIALIGLFAGSWIISEILQYFILGMTEESSWLYAVPLSILSSAIVIPSVVNLTPVKREFHIYESTFSDILGILFFYFLTGQYTPDSDVTTVGYGLSILFTIVISVLLSYGIILIFQRIERSAKLFLLIAVLLLLYALGKKLHLSSLIIILTFGLVIANTNLFFQGRLQQFLRADKIRDLYKELHIITAETAFVVRTMFFVVFGLTIVVSSLMEISVILISSLILLVIMVLRLVRIRAIAGKDIFPQVFIAPRGLITILLFYAIPPELTVENFEPGILLFVIISSGFIMTFGLVDKSNGSSKTNAKPNGSQGASSLSNATESAPE